MDLFLIKHKLQNDFPLVRETTLPHPQRAAVMVLLYPKPKKIHVLMTRRAMHLKYHAGEVSFPGGVFEEQDDDLLTTALRETEEELAIQVEPENVLGRLPVVNTRLGFEITPFVSVLPAAPEYEPAEHEVGEVLEIPFTSLLSTQQRDVGSKPSEEGVMYWFQHHRIWGASAKILKQISHLSSY
ncbi:MAG: CoA pyrophosphatase [Nitrospina sp.]|jgi:8-oxo-dGTP pyrophosphatase MutT (NUDIX family)|nr:CoA pyrophosphatase [Nitrospina sp.]MBT3414524.1 CoA pyrophosphatase [Nitrospina sp.]MBT4104605.1 CoA pyrophosphatase [Nitrospina sp.]MBT4390053.1 CoA pyrophosphatase [Nitrospina sp.]MBT4621154.1 CoA pyrophosphatase [Nitrospina sp.]